MGGPAGQIHRLVQQRTPLVQILLQDSTLRVSISMEQSFLTYGLIFKL